MQTYFYGRGRIANASIDKRNLTINWVSDYRPLGTDLIPDDTERNGGAFHDYSKGDPIGLEVYVWASHGVPTDDEVTLFQLDSLDRDQDPRARKLGTVQLLRDWWRRSETSDGGMVMRWGFRVLAFDQQELLSLVQSGEHHSLSFHPTQYTLPATDGKKTTRKSSKKAEQGNLSLAAGGELPGEGKDEATADAAQVQEVRQELVQNEQLQADCVCVLAALDTLDEANGEEIAIRAFGGGLTDTAELERFNLASCWIEDAGFVRRLDDSEVPQFSITPAGRAWLNARLAPTPVTHELVIDLDAGNSVLMELARLLKTGATYPTWSDLEAGSDVMRHASRICTTPHLLVKVAVQDLVARGFMELVDEEGLDVTNEGHLVCELLSEAAPPPSLPASLRRASNGDISDRRLAIWLGDRLHAKGDDGVSFGALRLLVDTHHEGQLVGQLNIERAAGVLQSNGLLTPKGRSKKLWTVNILTDEVWATARAFVQEMAESLDD